MFDLVLNYHLQKNTEFSLAISSWKLKQKCLKFPENVDLKSILYKNCKKYKFSVFLSQMNILNKRINLDFSFYIKKFVSKSKNE